MYDQGMFQGQLGHSLPWFDVQGIGLDPASLYPHVTERPPAIYRNPDPDTQSGTEATVVQYDPTSKFVSEEQDDFADALSPIYDQLRLAPLWWILEVIPQKQQYQKDEDNNWESEIRSVSVEDSYLLY